MKVFCKNKDNIEAKKKMMIIDLIKIISRKKLLFAINFDNDNDDDCSKVFYDIQFYIYFSNIARFMIFL